LDVVFNWLPARRRVAFRCETTTGSAVITAVSAGATSAVIVVVVVVVVILVVVAASLAAAAGVAAAAVVVSVFRQAAERPTAPVNNTTERISSLRFLMSEHLPASAANRASGVPEADCAGHSVTS
jgi:hypothetical protein